MSFKDSPLVSPGSQEQAFTTKVTLTNSNEPPKNGVKICYYYWSEFQIWIIKNERTTIKMEMKDQTSFT